jgi:hypothetical protein
MSVSKFMHINPNIETANNENIDMNLQHSKLLTSREGVKNLYKE